MTHASLQFPLHFSRFVPSVRLCCCLLLTVRKVVAYCVVAFVFTPFVLLLTVGLTVSHRLPVQGSTLPSLYVHVSLSAGLLDAMTIHFIIETHYHHRCRRHHRQCHQHQHQYHVTITIIMMPVSPLQKEHSPLHQNS